METEGICKTCANRLKPCPHWIAILKDDEYFNKHSTPKLITIVYACKEYKPE